MGLGDWSYKKKGSVIGGIVGLTGFIIYFLVVRGPEKLIGTIVHPTSSACPMCDFLLWSFISIAVTVLTGTGVVLGFLIGWLIGKFKSRNHLIKDMIKTKKEEKNLDYWKKGGLSGIILWGIGILILSILSIVEEGFASLLSMLVLFPIWIVYLIALFLVGALVGWIIGKIKSRGEK